MKFPLTVIITLLLIGNLFAEGFRLEIAYFDPVGGPLTLSKDSDLPLPDGCRAQVVMDGGDERILPTVSKDDYAAENLLLSGGTKSRNDVKQNAFTVNGTERLRTAGFFLSDPLISGDEVPSQPLFVRVWNAADPERATGYWDSPLYNVLPGFQQVSFLRSEWTYHDLPGNRKNASQNPIAETAAQSAEDVIAGSQELLTAYPNPFNATARVTFDVREAGRVRLRVFDLNGRLSATLADGVLSAGTQNIDFNGTALPTGLYFLSLEQEGAAPQVRKIVLMR